MLSLTLSLDEDCSVMLRKNIGNCFQRDAAVELLNHRIKTLILPLSSNMILGDQLTSWSLCKMGMISSPVSEKVWEDSQFLVKIFFMVSFLSYH